MSKNFHAIILAAGEGKRYFSSGGESFKQVVTYNDKPIIRQTFDILTNHEAVSSVRIVVGNNSDCVDKIRNVLPKDHVHFVYNLDSERDNNQISFMVGTEEIRGGVIVVEADCIFDTKDISAISLATGSKDITWANIGSLSNFDYGGTIFIDDLGNVENIDILDQKGMANVKAKKCNSLKLFGIAAFGDIALREYRKTIVENNNLYNRYFHSAAIDYPERFSLKTVRMSEHAFSFNTISEIKQKTNP